MKEKLISVIIPVYNVEKYLKRSVLSVLNQDYKNLEIILVNDGSTDSSGEICEELKAKDTRIVVIHKKNQGLGEARNSAIEIMKGEYVLYLDSDDYIYPGIISKLYNAIEKEQADISCCGYRSGKKIYYCNKKEIVIGSIEATRRMFCNEGIDANACCKLYKSALFQKIRYANCAYEVVPVTYRIFLEAKKIVTVNECGYYIEKREGSITRSTFGYNNMLYVKLAKDVYEKVKTEYSELEKEAYVFYLNALIGMAEKAVEDKMAYRTKEYNEIMQEMKLCFVKIICNKKISGRKKLITCLIKLRIYPFVRKIYLCTIG